MGRGATTSLIGTLKKLIEAGYVYASGVTNPAEDELENEQVPDWWRERLRGKDCHVNDEVWPVFELFRACATQWRVSSMGTRTGLDYTAVLAVARVMGLDSAENFEHIRSLELGALAAYMGKPLEFVLDG